MQKINIKKYTKDQMAKMVEDAVEELRAFKVRRLRERIDKNA